MSSNKLKLIAPLIALIVVFGGIWMSNTPSGSTDVFVGKSMTAAELVAKTQHKEEPKRLDNPGEFAKYHQLIRTRYGDDEPKYKAFHTHTELKKIKNKGRSAFRVADENIEWKSRGPSNVPGRTRGLIAMPDDQENHWFAGAVAGGVWETTDAGQSWSLSTPDELSYSVSWLDYCNADPNVIYASTGEQSGSTNTTYSGGVLKSTDGGQTWEQLASTIEYDEPAIWRIVVDPTNPDIFVYCASQGSYKDNFSSSIYKSTDGGATVTKVYEGNSWITQIISDPNDFNNLYAATYASSILKSTDMGESWVQYSDGLQTVTGRIELAISPSDPSRLYASAESSASGEGSDIYASFDAGISWSVILDEENGNVDFLGGQGGYDNTVMVDPFNPDLVYSAGVNVWRTYVDQSIEPDTAEFVDYVLNTSEAATAWDFTNFSASYSAGRVDIGNLDADEFVNIELRVGDGNSQMAHRFTVGKQGAGVPDDEYIYQDYVAVPFEVWDVDNNQQLMVSFRDQQEDGSFTLLNSKTDGDGANHSREYIYIHKVNYSDTPDASIAQNGSATNGHNYENMYFFWPVLSDDYDNWDNTNPPIDIVSITVRNIEGITRYGQIANVSDAYLEYSEKNAMFGEDQPGAFHPDHHNLMAISIDESKRTYRILNANDGGVFISKRAISPGLNNGDWTFSGWGYISGQFYGADKAPGEDLFVGGLQDNGTWLTITPDEGEEVNEASEYRLVIGGDGFEAIWNYADGNKFIGSNQFNGIYKTEGKGIGWTDATSGLEGDGPFISRLANSNSSPDVIFAVTTVGVGRSVNFGTSWEMTPIEEKWGFTNSTDIEVSLANARIVWAGAGMDPDRSLHVSTDQGETFTPVNGYKEPMGAVTGINTHPTEPNTAYALFSFAGAPKILKTEDLGQTWVDISGYSDGDSSSTGFPDVAVYSLLVRPDDENKIWVGTEIGIVESNDAGATWHHLPSFPPVPVWQMKAVDDQIVIATHGRGIYTTTVEALPEVVISPSIYDAGLSPSGAITMSAALNHEYDSVSVFFNEELSYTFEQISSGDTLLTLSYDEGLNGSNASIQLVGYKAGLEYYSVKSNLDLAAIPDAVDEYYSNFNDGQSDFEGFGFRITQVSGFDDKAIHTDHPYLEGGDYGGELNYIYQLKNPVRISATNPIMKYKDVAIVETGVAGSSYGDNDFWDYVIVEGSLDGVTWKPFMDGYDADFNSGWLSNYESEAKVTSSLFVSHEVDLSEVFEAGDEIFIRFRMFSDQATAAWGWTIDDLSIQREIVLSNQPFDLQVGPNPTTGVINIIGNYDEVEVMSLDGKKLKTYTIGQGTVDISSLRKGLYLLKVKVDNEQNIYKVIKE